MTRIMRTDEVVERTGLSRSSIWRQEQNGSFPARRKIGRKAVGWLSSEVKAWIENRPRATTEIHGTDSIRPSGSHKSLESTA